LRAICPHPATAMPLPPKDYAPTTSPSIADNIGKHPRMDREASPTTMSVGNQLSKALQHPEVVSQVGSCEFFRPVRLASYMTAKRSPPNNRAVRSTPGRRWWSTYDSERVAHLQVLGHPFRVLVQREPSCRGCSLRSYPRLLSGDAFSVISTLQVEFLLGCILILSMVRTYCDSLKLIILYPYSRRKAEMLHLWEKFFCFFFFF
jgi:hypothetical protein